jgi:hypothetical protein
MNPTRIILKAYYERLHDRLEARRAPLLARIDVLLSAEIERRRFGPMGPEKVEAYREACRAFVDERLEMYNPIGIQYTFDRQSSRQAAELEFQLNWYDSRTEFEQLVTAARSLAAEGAPDEGLADLADALIEAVGAFPDRSIIAAYAEQPALQKLPDFIVAFAIEQVICGRAVDLP